MLWGTRQQCIDSVEHWLEANDTQSILSKKHTQSKYYYLLISPFSTAPSKSSNNNEFIREQRDWAKEEGEKSKIAKKQTKIHRE